MQVDAPVRADLPPLSPPAAVQAAGFRAESTGHPVSGQAPRFCADPHRPPPPVRSGSLVRPLWGGIALVFLLLAGVGLWELRSGNDGSSIRRALETPISAPTPTSSAPTVDPEAVIPGRAPPTAGGSRPSVSVANEVPLESAAGEAPVDAGDPGATRRSGSLPALPVTDDPVDLQGLKAAVLVAGARDIDALYAAGAGERGPETRDALDGAIRALAKGFYRHHVIDGHGDADRARAELRSFLRGVEHRGLGLADAVVEGGVVHVGP